MRKINQLLMGICVLGLSGEAWAESYTFVLSGGGSPSSNHYSQYLQTKTLADSVRELQSSTSMNVRFGAGYNYTSQPAYADVHRVVKDADTGVKYSQLTVGKIEGNAPATKAGVYETFEELSKREFSQDDTFFMIVSDHGMPSKRNDLSNNCIDLWGTTKDGDQLKHSTFQEQCLSQKELAKLLKEKVSAPKKVFAMSQCFSGGFHMMSVKDETTFPTADTSVCGYTAITHDDVASGCTPDVDGPSYQGYERYLTQQITGVDVVTGDRLREAKASLLEAHEAAALEDMTVDIPLSTLDYYLWAWSKRFNEFGFIGRSVDEKVFAKAEKLKKSVQSFEAEGLHPEAKRKLAYFKQMEEAIAKRFGDAAPYLSGSFEQLTQGRVEIAAQINKTSQAYSGLARERNSALRYIASHFHKTATLEGVKVSSLDQMKMETQVIPELIKAQVPVLEKFAIEAITQPDAAQELAIYLASRTELIKQWAETESKDPHAHSAVQYLKNTDLQMAQLKERSLELSKIDSLLRRAIIYRQSMGTWAALEAMEDKQAMAEIDGLIGCLDSDLPFVN